MHVVTHGLITNYTLSGKGPLVVLLHGWGDSMSTFADIEKQLLASYSVLKLDLPGFGGTQPPEEPYDLSDYIDFVAALLEKIGKSSVYAFVGHSNGGSIAIKAIAQEKLKSEKLVLLASAGIRSSDSMKKSLYRSSAKLAKVPLLALPKSRRDNIKRKVYSKIGSDLHVAEGMQETFKKVVAEDVLEYAKQLHIPTLLVYGDTDSATPLQYGEAYKEAIANSELRILAGAGHFVHQERSDEVATYMMEFLQS